MFNKYYLQELKRLRELSREFAKAHPATAAMLDDKASDPDVERLLEGVAFLNGQVREKLDDQLPEMIESLTRVFFPQYLRPIPATTMMQFSPKAALSEPVAVNKGTEVVSRPVENTACRFRTSYDVHVQPFNLTSARFIEEPGTSARIRIEFTLTGITLADWQPTSLQLYLADSFRHAVNVYYLLSQYVAVVKLHAPQSETLELTSASVQAKGFSDDEALLSYTENAYPGFRILQEYYTQPKKFLFLQINDLERWQKRGSDNKFYLDFLLKQVPDWMPDITQNSFRINVTPAVNLFRHDAEPIQLTHRSAEYRVLPASEHKRNYIIYSVDHLHGTVQGQVDRKEYIRFEWFHPHARKDLVYHVKTQRALVGKGKDVYLSFNYDFNQGMPEPEILSTELTCSNGFLPESLGPGDINQPSHNSPERIDFSNLDSPTAFLAPVHHEERLWHLLSLLSLNYMSIATADNLRKILELYIFDPEGKGSFDAVNRRRIDGIIDLQVNPANRYVSGIMLRGLKVRLICRSDYYINFGDLFLFGSIIHNFLSSYASINTFTEFSVEDSITGEVIAWPISLAAQPLL